MIECALCKRAVDTRSAHRCGMCAAALCPDCAGDYNYVCPECGAGDEER